MWHSRSTGWRPLRARRPASCSASRADSARMPSRRGSSLRIPTPKWVAPPGESLHRYATELDLGPREAYAWLGANATRFGFLQRYSWEPRLLYTPEGSEVRGTQ